MSYKMKFSLIVVLFAIVTFSFVGCSDPTGPAAPTLVSSDINEMPELPSINIILTADDTIIYFNIGSIESHDYTSYPDGVHTINVGDDWTLAGVKSDGIQVELEITAPETRTDTYSDGSEATVATGNTFTQYLLLTKNPTATNMGDTAFITAAGTGTVTDTFTTVFDYSI